MSNDRVLIKCKACGNLKVFMKYFPGELTSRDFGLFEWLDSHKGCHGKFGLDLDGDPCFSLVTESGMS